MITQPQKRKRSEETPLKANKKLKKDEESTTSTESDVSEESSEQEVKSAPCTPEKAEIPQKTASTVPAKQRESGNNN
eukprot:Pgem_evm1s17274